MDHLALKLVVCRGAAAAVFPHYASRTHHGGHIFNFIFFRDCVNVVSSKAAPP
jgi:hypothetical protein